MERATGAEVGADWRLGEHDTLAATVFDSWVRNFITNDADAGVATNHDRFHFIGLELQARLNPVPSLMLPPA